MTVVSLISSLKQTALLSAPFFYRESLPSYRNHLHWESILRVIRCVLIRDITEQTNTQTQIYPQFYFTYKTGNVQQSDALLLPSLLFSNGNLAVLFTCVRVQNIKLEFLNSWTPTLLIKKHFFMYQAKLRSNCTFLLLVTKISNYLT
jgi:hypothetical protein